MNMIGLYNGIVTFALCFYYRFQGMGYDHPKIVLVLRRLTYSEVPLN